MPSCKAIFLPEGISDHCLARVSFSEDYKIRKSFKFCNVWAEHPQFKEIVEDSWKVNIEGVEASTLKNFQNILIEANEDRERLKNKATWIRLGDDNTKYLYLVIKHRKLQHATSQLKNRSGVWENDPAEIAKLIVEYYEDILGRKTEHIIKAVNELICQGTTLSEGQQNELIKNFEPSKVKKAIFQIDSNKSPEPDGFGSGFIEQL
ncbi:hypothetical protein H5410_063055, partial [Solanum commersonii]